MIPASWTRWAPMRAAFAALLGALALAVFTFLRAVQLTDVPSGALPVLPDPGALVAPATPVALDIASVVGRDVFASDRIPPTNAYLLPSEIEQDVTPASAPPRLVVLGIALADGGRSFATCQVGTDRPTIVRVGDKLGPYTVKAIERKRVVFASPSGATQAVAALTSGT